MDAIAESGRKEKSPCIFLCSADHELDWQPYLVDPIAESAEHACIHPEPTYICFSLLP